MLMDGDHLGRIAYETIRQLGDMDKPVFLDPYIDETTEVGDVVHDTGQYLPFFQILDRFHRRIEREYLDRLAGITVPASLHIYPKGGHSFGFRDNFVYKRQWTDELEKWLSTIE